MTTHSPPPPLTAFADLPAQLQRAGFAVVDAHTLSLLCDCRPALTAPWVPFWNDLPPDTHLRDGGRYRPRRHGSFVVEAGTVTPVPHRAHWQPLEYNALHGGIERWFEPLDARFVESPAFGAMLLGIGRVAGHLHDADRWYVEAHAFRIDTTDGIGRPTPEGAHRDGVDLVAVVLVSRHNVKGGETRVFEIAGHQGVRFTLLEPFAALLLDDRRVIHESTPIQPIDASAPGWRDTLVLTYRRDGFQEPAAMLRG